MSQKKPHDLSHLTVTDENGEEQPIFPEVIAKSTDNQSPEDIFFFIDEKAEQLLFRFKE